MTYRHRRRDLPRTGQLCAIEIRMRSCSADSAAPSSHVPAESAPFAEPHGRDDLNETHTARLVTAT